MVERRRRRGFGQAADLPLEQLGLPAARARQLLLDKAWRDVAGAPIAARARALGIRRGVLELDAPDQPWRETLIELLPQLAARLAARYPELGVRKFRLCRDEGPLRETTALPPLDPVPERPAPEAPSSDPADAEPTPSLERLRALYLMRRSIAQDQKP